MRSTTLVRIFFGGWPLMASVAVAQPIELPEPDEDEPPVVADAPDEDEGQQAAGGEESDEGKADEDKGDVNPTGETAGKTRPDSPEPAPSRGPGVAPSVSGGVQAGAAASSVEASVEPLESPDPLGPPLFVTEDVPAEAPLPPLLFPSASFFARYENRDRYEAIGASRARWREGDAVAYRARFGLRTEALDIGDAGRVSVQFTPQASGLWGTLGDTLMDANLGLHEGYLRVGGSWARVDAGRFVMNYGDSLVIGSVDWHQTGRSFDGARSRFFLGSEEPWLDLFVTQTQEGLLDDRQAFGEGDALFSGLYASLGPALAPKLALDLYVLAQLWPKTREVPVDPEDADSELDEQRAAGQLTTGARVKDRRGPLDYRAELGLQFGTRPRPGESQKSLAYQGDAEAGLNVLDDRLRVALEGFYASGDDPETDRAEGWDELYPTGHKWLGLSDIIGPRTNIYGGVAHLGVNVTSEFALKWQGHLFFRQFEQVDAYAGAELDSLALYKLGSGLNLRGMWALFAADRDRDDEQRVANYFELELRYDYE